MIAKKLTAAFGAATLGLASLAGCSDGVNGASNEVTTTDNGVNGTSSEVATADKINLDDYLCPEGVWNATIMEDEAESRRSSDQEAQVGEYIKYSLNRSSEKTFIKDLSKERRAEIIKNDLDKVFATTRPYDEIYISLILRHIQRIDAPGSENYYDINITLSSNSDTNEVEVKIEPASGSQEILNLDMNQLIDQGGYHRDDSDTAFRVLDMQDVDYAQEIIDTLETVINNSNNEINNYFIRDFEVSTSIDSTRDSFYVLKAHDEVFQGDIFINAQECINSRTWYTEFPKYNN